MPTSLTVAQRVHIFALGLAIGALMGAAICYPREAMRDAEIAFSPLSQILGFAHPIDNALSPN